MSVELNDITSGYSTGLINDNFQLVEDELNNNVLHRDGLSPGEANQMEVALDMNSNFVYNLPEPVLEHQAARLQDVQNAITGGNVANLVTFTPYGNITAGNVQGAIQELADGTGQSVTTSTGTESLVQSLDSRSIYVDTVSSLKGLTSSELNANQSAHVTTTGRAGLFVWTLGDQSANVSGDALEGIWVAPSDAPTGSSGAWKRLIPEASILPEWWGAQNDGTAVSDTTAALQAAIDFAEANDNYKIVLQGGEYAINETLTKGQSFSAPIIEGRGFKYTRLSYAFGVGDKPALLIKGGSGQDSGGYIQGIGFDGDSQSTGVEVQGQIGFVVRDCQFGLNANGVLYHNFASGEFTEYCVAEHCDFEQDCTVAVRYKRTDGNESFHGCGLKACKINEKLGVTTGAIVIGGNCLPYNSPMDFQIWKRTSQPIIIHGGSGGANVHGHLTVETFGTNQHVIADGPTVLTWVGGFSSFGPYTQQGPDVSFCSSLQVNSDRSVATYRMPKSFSEPLTTGDNDFPLYTAPGETLVANVHISGTDYQYEDQLVIKRSTGGFVNSGALVEEHRFRSLNVAGHGDPVYTLVNGDTLRISNGSYPASGLDVVITLHYVGARVDKPFTS